MIADLKPYADYKESGLPWLGKVPGHWSVGRIKTVLRETDCRSADGSGTLLSLTRVRGLIPHKDMTDKVHSAKTLVGYKRYSTGQLVMNRMQAWSGMFGAGAIDGLVSPDYAVFDVLGGHAVNLVLQRLKTPDLVAQFALESKGIGSGFNRLYTDRFGPIPISLPPPVEQALIVRFLDWANGRLERAIRAKRKVIALLNEQKQAIIHRAVTRGLDPSVPVKPSGVPWLGDIPQHWDVATIGATATLIQTGPFGSQLHSHEYVSSGIPVINPSHMVGGQVKASLAVTIRREKANELSRHVLRSGDIVIARRGELGRCALVTGGEEGWICGTGSLLLRCKACCHPAFFRIVFSSRGIADMLSLSSIGATMANLNAGMVARQRLPLPPLDEQERIVRFIEDEADKGKIAVSRLEREIELLREYRTRLVADVVTGKLDVREAATHLPEEAAPDTVEEDTDLSLDPETADEEAVA